MKKILTIAGSDPSGGAGIQADLKTITCHKMYGMSVITAITAQNTLGVQKVFPVKKEALVAQLQSVFEDIFPDAVKIGQIPDRKLTDLTAKMLKKYEPKNIVVDPCMVSTSGHRLIDESAIAIFEKDIFPYCACITPNILEAEYLLGDEIKEINMKEAAKALCEKYGTPVLVKGGHGSGEYSTDFLYDGGEFYQFSQKRIDNPNTHGTGCTLSSAIACNLAKGQSLHDAIFDAKEYISGAIAYKLNIGHGRGPLFHAYNVKI